MYKNPRIYEASLSKLFAQLNCLLQTKLKMNVNSEYENEKINRFRKVTSIECINQNSIVILVLATNVDKYRIISHKLT